MNRLRHPNDRPLTVSTAPRFAVGARVRVKEGAQRANDEFAQRMMLPQWNRGLGTVEGELVLGWPDVKWDADSMVRSTIPAGALEQVGHVEGLMVGKGRQGEAWEGPPVGSRVKPSQEWLEGLGAFAQDWAKGEGTVESHPPPGDDWHGTPAVKWDADGKVRKLVPGSALVRTGSADPVVAALEKVRDTQKAANAAMEEFLDLVGKRYEESER